MERKQRLPMKVSGPETKPQKTVLKRLEGGRKQLQMTTTKSRSSERDKDLLIARFITRMVKASLLPPAYNATKTRTCRRRFISSPTVAITSLDFTIQVGHRQFLVVVSVAGTAVCWVDMWRIKSVSVWTISYVDNPTTCEIRPSFTDTDDNCFNDREAIYSISSRSESEPASMKIVPARDTPMGSWHKTTVLNPTASLFNINVNNGGASSGNWATTTLDVEFEYIENLVGANPGYSLASLITSLGTMGGCNNTSALLLQDINVLN